MANTNNTVITVSNMESAAVKVMAQARKAIDPNHIEYLLYDAIEVTARLADNNMQSFFWTASEGGYWICAFHCTDTGVYSYCFSDAANTARDKNKSSVLVTVKHWQERDEWQVTIL